jgi:hypothetical protein
VEGAASSAPEPTKRFPPLEPLLTAYRLPDRVSQDLQMGTCKIPRPVLVAWFLKFAFIRVHSRLNFLFPEP